MESQLKVSFFLNHSKRTKTRRTPIYLRLRYNNEHLTISTGYTVGAATWDKKSKRVRGTSPQVKSINNGLKSLEVNVRNTVNQMILNGKPFQVKNIKDLV